MYQKEKQRDAEIPIRIVIQTCTIRVTRLIQSVPVQLTAEIVMDRSRSVWIGTYRDCIGFSWSILLYPVFPRRLECTIISRSAPSPNTSSSESSDSDGPHMHAGSQGDRESAAKCEWINTDEMQPHGLKRCKISSRLQTSMSAALIVVSHRVAQAEWYYNQQPYLSESPTDNWLRSSSALY